MFTEEEKMAFTVYQKGWFNTKPLHINYTSV